MGALSFPGLGLELSLNTVAFSIGSISIAWYGIFVTTGMVTALLLAYHMSKKAGIVGDTMLNVSIITLISGVIGARLYYVAFQWDSYANNLGDIFRINEGGLAIYGGIIFGMLGMFVACKIYKVPFFPALDSALPGVIIAQGIGQWGNFFNHEAFGSNTTLPWGMTSDKISSYLSSHQAELAAQGITVDPALPVHPTFFYESIWCLIGGILLLKMFKNRKFDGQISLMYIAFYGLERAIVEGLRTDSLMIGSFRVSQVVAILGFIFATALLIVVRAKINARNDKDYLPLYATTDDSREKKEAFEAKVNAKKKRKDDLKEIRSKKGKTDSEDENEIEEVE